MMTERYLVIGFNILGFTFLKLDYGYTIMLNHVVSNFLIETYKKFEAPFPFLLFTHATDKKKKKFFHF